jgi:hypothetical protein
MGATMITSDEFMSRALSAIELMALSYAHLPDDVAEQSIVRIRDNLRREWRELLSVAVLPDDGLAEVVEDVLARVRTRRREIEAGGVGSA